ncbi:MAG: integrase core domain-containing protein [Actinomycetota bacterium]|nr:integrase core domain-containing protein [Actinomycetota bacterium]
MGLTAGPAPARLDGEVKERLLKLVDDAVVAGWAHTRACDLLGVADVRVHRWRARLREHGTLTDRAPGGNPVHRLLAWEEAAILALIEDWGVTDRSHRKLAHRGSYTGAVFVSPSSVLRVAAKHQVSLPGEPPRPPRPAPLLPAVPWERNRIWIWDASHFTRAHRVAYAIVDVVTRYWIGYLLTSEMTSTQVQLLFAAALEDQGLVDPASGVLRGSDGRPLERAQDSGPILVAWSDNGPEMTAADTRQFMALMAIAQHHGRPGTPTDQAHVESFFSHLKGDWPHLCDIRDPAVIDAELARVRRDYNTVRLHAGIGYVTPDDEHHGRGPAIRRARAVGLKQAHQDRVEHNRKHRPGSTP